ncbi:type II toxin-antitoxin system Phd/YefM family antitoxin [Mesorhizobium sp. AR10]|uniref:type II toxin-antitoxin system Phd/YefM family antitoxin n=1 Tax=Mesorhizobium sp. AR10 TaxID=2865839 RepID=UPI00215E08E2|nr:type II toxin-antitoxin system Phd/YefM family antitoxin [Mesorhizobium sp. AR10]
MKVDFKTLKMMELRSSPGEVLDRVARDGEVFIVERNGQPKACLVPVSFLLPDIPPERIAKDLNKLDGNDTNYKLTINDSKELEISCLEKAADEDIVITVVLPHGYPNSAPRLYAEQVAPNAPHRWPDGSLSIFGATAAWNSKTHDAAHALNLARGWLKHYAKWRKTGNWPGASEAL